MFTIALLFVCALIALIYLWLKSIKRKYADLDTLPGPKPHFLFGNSLEFGNTVVGLFSNMQRLFNAYGPTFRIWINPVQLAVFTVELDIVEYFLSSNVHIKKSEGYDLFQAWLGQGLINSSGEIWKRHRKILTPAFHMKILEQFSDSFHKYGKLLIQNLEQTNNQAIEIHKFMNLYAMDAICDSSMRIDAGAQQTGDMAYLDTVRQFLEVFEMRFFSFFKRYDFLFQFSGEYKQYRKDIEFLQTFTRTIIKQRKLEKNVDDTDEEIDEFGRRKRKKVFLDILLDTNMTEEEIRDEVDTFLFGGHDTVSSAISFGLFELAKYPDIQAKILEEIESVVGLDISEPITVQHLNQMDYLDRVFKEILRLYPVAPIIERELEEDIILNGLHYPKGTTLSFNIYIQHRLKEHFPDPEKFDPDRFLPENIATRHKFAYIPYSAGPRNCIGQKYATINCKTTIANVIRHFVVQELEPPHQVILFNSAVLKSENGLLVKFLRRF